MTNKTFRSNVEESEVIRLLRSIDNSLTIISDILATMEPTEPTSSETEQSLSE